MKLIINIETNNDGVQTVEDVQDILNKITSKIEYKSEASVYDVNGNNIGWYVLTLNNDDE